MRTNFRVALIAFLCTVLTAQADIALPSPKKPAKKGQAVTPAPAELPEPVPLHIRVRKGGSVDIPLRVFGIPNQPFTYRIRALPEFGKLSEPRMAGRGIGVVTYQHSGDDMEERDQFRYAVRTERGVSVS